MIEKLIIINLYVFPIVGGVCVFVGFDLKKWYGWLIGLYGFLSGAVVGLLREGGSISLQLGALFAIAVILGGVKANQFRQHYNKDAAKNWLAQFGQAEHLSCPFVENI